MTQLRGTTEPSLVAHLSPDNRTLVERYKWEPLPKLEVYRPENGKPPLYPQDAGIIAVASDMASPDGLHASVAWLDLNPPSQVHTWIMARIRLGPLPAPESHRRAPIMIGTRPLNGAFHRPKADFRQSSKDKNCYRYVFSCLLRFR